MKLPKKVVIEYIKAMLAGRTLIVITHDEEDIRLLGADVLFM